MHLPATEHYQGFTIAVTARPDQNGRFAASYRLLQGGGQDGDPSSAILRSDCAGGHASAALACQAALLRARREIDHILALAGVAASPTEGSTP